MSDPLRLLSVCAGIGAIDYVWSHILRQEIAGQVEIDPFCLAVLAKHWPLVPRLTDIREVQGDEYGPVDLVAGGIPCQPFSTAGKRAGTADDRYLWPEMLRIVRRSQPTWVLVENVAHFIPLVLDSVSADLEAEGYQVRAFVLPACAVGAPHIRERAFIVAHTDQHRRGQRTQQSQCQPRSGGPSDVGIDGTSGPLANAAGDGCRSQRPQCSQQPWGLQAGGSHSSCPAACDVAHVDGAGLAQRPAFGGDPETGPCTPSQRGGVEIAQYHRCPRRPSAHGPGAGAALFSSSAHAWRVPEPGMGGSLDGLSDWLDGTAWPALPGEVQHAWEPARTTRKKGARRKRVHALGNAIVPQQIYPILRGIVEIERAQLGAREEQYGGV
ncbi:MAG: DNA cytosine methyltransferase [Ktedonobacteraceae bacterium]|nr:DNA cytosine methyltransferase [Ktedonobacteraceae bacterium]